MEERHSSNFLWEHKKLCLISFKFRFNQDGIEMMSSIWGYLIYWTDNVPNVYKERSAAKNPLRT